MVEAIGWTTFFGFTFLVAIPGLLLLFAMRGNIEKLGRA
jgi:PAT family beta-lactamase induction signal transducer AmpG